MSSSFHWIPSDKISGQTTPVIDPSQFENIFAQGKKPDPNRVFLCLSEDNKAVAIVSLYEHPSMANIHLEFLEVAKDARGHKFSRQLVEELFKSTQAKGKVVTSDGFTDQGKSHLLKIINEQQAKYGDKSFASAGRV